MLFENYTAELSVPVLKIMDCNTFSPPVYEITSFPCQFLPSERGAGQCIITVHIIS